jgi:hypothetical protein
MDLGLKYTILNPKIGVGFCLFIKIKKTIWEGGLVSCAFTFSPPECAVHSSYQCCPVPAFEERERERERPWFGPRSRVFSK